MTDPASTSAVSLLAEIADLGRDPVRGGYTRSAFQPAELELRAWFSATASALGLTVQADGNSNLWAWWGTPGSDAVVTGSHLDSVPGGGAYDGPLGVVSALAAVARLRATGFAPARPFAVAVFTEEEGSRFGLACLGSRLLSGAVSPERALALSDSDGVTFGAALTAAGGDPQRVGRDDAALASIGCFVELHVEQGRDLVERGEPVAVATSILAHGRWRMRFTGEGNHAGTTPMRDRHDPIVALAAAILAARRRGAAPPPGATPTAGAIPPADAIPPSGRIAGAALPRATVGRINVIPGGTNVIASIAEGWLDVRAGDEAAVRALVDAVADDAREAARAEGCAFELIEESFAPEVVFDPALRDRLAALLGDVPTIPTGAGHDAGVLAAEVSTAMLFVRNPSGISHAPAEWADDDDCEAGVDALERILRELL